MRKLLKRLFGLTIIPIILAVSTPVSAEVDLLDVLRGNKTITEEQYLKLKKDAAKGADFKLQIGGRLMVDAAFYDDDKTDLSNGTEIRRVRVGVEGTIYSVWDYEAEFDFSGNEADVKDAWLGYSGFKSAKIKIGNFKEPFSLEEQTSSKYITFMERALPNVFAPGRNIGIGFNSQGKNWALAGGVFSEGVGDESAKDEGYGASGRLAFAPVNEKRNALHLGLSLAARVPDDESESVAFDERPESHIAEKLLDTGDITNVDHYITYALEAAYVLGPISIQGEYIATKVKREKGFEDAGFDGAYIYASCFLTGESRPYKAKKGKFGRVKPISKDGFGAWEVAMRYSTLDLNDGVITAGEMDNITFGLNWYANPNVRFMANYIMVDTDEKAGNDDPRIFQMRAQVDF